MYLRSDLSKTLKLIANLVASGHVHAFTKYTSQLNSLKLKRQKKNSLRNDASAKHSIKQQTFVNAFLLTCHHKKRKNSMPYLTNIGSFSKAPSDSNPPNLFTSKSNPMPSLSMDAHYLFQKPTKSVPKAYKNMIRDEVEHLCHLNILHWWNESEWAAPSFGTPKKNGQI
jgi:hypothetical protein